MMANEDFATWTSAHLLSRLYDYAVLDVDGVYVGVVSALWTDDLRSRIALFGVRSRAGADHVVPADPYRVDHRRQEIHLSQSKRAMEGAPKFVAPDDFTPDEFTRLWNYYGIHAPAVPDRTKLPPSFPLTASHLMAVDGPSGVVAGESAEDVGLEAKQEGLGSTFRKLRRTKVDHVGHGVGKEMASTTWPSR